VTTDVVFRHGGIAAVRVFIARQVVANGRAVLSVCPSVTLVIHVKTVQDIEMLFAT